MRSCFAENPVKVPCSGFIIGTIVSFVKGFSNFCSLFFTKKVKSGQPRAVWASFAVWRRSRRGDLAQCGDLARRAARCNAAQQVATRSAPARHTAHTNSLSRPASAPPKPSEPSLQTRQAQTQKPQPRARFAAHKKAAGAGGRRFFPRRFGCYCFWAIALWNTFLPLRILTPAQSFSRGTARPMSVTFSPSTDTPPC